MSNNSALKISVAAQARQLGCGDTTTKTIPKNKPSNDRRIRVGFFLLFAEHIES